MGLLKWMQKKGSLGGIARSVANAYRRMVKQSPNLSNLERLIILSNLRYSNPISIRMFPNGGMATLAYIHHRISIGEDIGLLTICFGFAAHEMDVAGIENDVAVVLAEVLYETGFSDKEIFGKRYSVEEFDEAIQRLATEQSSNILNAPLKE